MLCDAPPTVLNKCQSLQSYGSDYEEHCLLECDTMWSANSLAVQKNMQLESTLVTFAFFLLKQPFVETFWATLYTKHKPNLLGQYSEGLQAG